MQGRCQSPGDADARISAGRIELRGGFFSLSGHRLAALGHY
jgi:hypothetical protein